MNRRPFRYTPPKASKQLVPRQRLLGPLARRFEVPLTLLVGGAGFGKTSLLEQMLGDGHQSLGQELWLGCEPADSSGDHLAGGLAHLLGLDAPSRAPGAEELAAEIWRRTPQQVLLILDDVHAIDPDSEGMALLTALLEALPSNGHLLLASRLVPAIPTARLRAHGELIAIDEQMLAFDAVERAGFAALRGVGSEISTQSWPALAELETEVGRRGARDFVAEEVLQRLEPENRKQLAALSLHGVVDDGFARALGIDPTDLDPWLSNLPLLSRDADGRIRLHDLWQEFLVEELSDQERRLALIALARELVARGELRRAYDYFLEVDDDDGLLDIVDLLARDFEMALEREIFVRVTTTLPERLEREPRVELLRAAWHFQSDPLSAKPELVRVAEALAKDEFLELEVTALFYLADLAYRSDALGELRTIRDRAEALAERQTAEAAALFALCNVWVSIMTEPPAQTMRYLEEPALAASRYAAGPLAFLSVSAFYNWGDCQRAIDEAEQLPGGPAGRFGSMLVGTLMMCRWHRGLLTDERLEGGEEILDGMERAGHTHIAALGAAAFAKFHASMGNLETAQRYVARSERHQTPDASGWITTCHALAASSVDVLAGREGAAQKRLKDLLAAGEAVRSRNVHARSLTLIYALAPESRAEWDGDDLGPDYLRARGIARALVALREHGQLEPARDLEWKDLPLLRCWAFEPHLLELALAAHAAGNPDAIDVVETLRADVRTQLDALTRHSHQAVARVAADVRRVSPIRAEQSIRIELLGGLRLFRGDLPVSDSDWVKRARVRSLLAILASRGRVTRGQVALILWPDKSEQATRNNLRVTLSYLMRLLEPMLERRAPSWFVRQDGDSLELRGSDLLHLDTAEFDRHLRKGEAADAAGRPAEALTALSSACALYRGEFLEDVPLEHFDEALRANYRGQFVSAATRAGDLRLARGEYQEAAELASRAVAADEFAEDAWRLLVRSHLAAGQRGPAREAMDAALRALRDADLEPDAESLRLAAGLGRA